MGCLTGLRFRHIHWYERTFPLGTNGTIDKTSIIDNNTFSTNPGKSMTHIINGMAGNVESHSTFLEGQSRLDLSCVLDLDHYGFSKLTIVNETVLTWSFVKGIDGSSGDDFTLVKRGTEAPGHSAPSGAIPASSKTAVDGVVPITEVVHAYTTFCPEPTTFTQGSKTYVVTQVRLGFCPRAHMSVAYRCQATLLTITDCPCTISHPGSTPASVAMKIIRETGTC